MAFKEILLTVLLAATANNLVFTEFLGISSWAADNKKYLGPAVTAVMLIAAAICTPVSALLSSAGLEGFNILAFALIILAVCTILELICGSKLGLGFPLIALNSAVLGLVVNNAAQSSGFLNALLSALGAGLGFWLALIIMSSLQLKLENSQIPKAFKGYPIKLLAAGIISMAVFAF